MSNADDHQIAIRVQDNVQQRAAPPCRSPESQNARHQEATLTTSSQAKICFASCGTGSELIWETALVLADSWELQSPANQKGKQYRCQL